MMSEEPQEVFYGLDDGVKTAIGFGGKILTRDARLVIGDDLYLLMHCEVVSDGRTQKKSDEGKLMFKAGARTTILAELDAKTAGQIAADHG